MSISSCHLPQCSKAPSNFTFQWLLTALWVKPNSLPQPTRHLWSDSCQYHFLTHDYLRQPYGLLSISLSLYFYSFLSPNSILSPPFSHGLILWLISSSLSYLILLYNFHPSITIYHMTPFFFFKQHWSILEIVTLVFLGIHLFIIFSPGT